MAKKSSIAKQKRRAEIANRHKEKRIKLKQTAANLNLSEEERHEARIALNKMTPNGSRVRLRNRCAVTGRCRGFLRKFGISRLTFREWASSGKIPGITKSSW